MISLYIILKNLSNILFLAILIFILNENIGFAQFRNAQDVEIVKDVLLRFGKECPLKSIIDEDVVKQLEVKHQDVRKQKNELVQKCYENNYSQLVGVFHLYRKLCEDASIKTKEFSDRQMGRQLIDISKFQMGIRTYHSLLNDCLMAIPEKEGKPFVVPLAGNELNTKILLEQIQEAKVNPPYPSTVEPFR